MQAVLLGSRVLVPLSAIFGNFGIRGNRVIAYNENEFHFHLE
jgi:hypothetical protein